ncbi:MAG: TRAP transporter small permease [Peptococcaceae bacterium]
MHFLRKLDKIWTVIEEHIIAILLMIMTGITFWGVISRFILNDASPWAEEAARYLSIWAAFIGASLGVKKGAHIGVEAFVMILPAAIKKYIEIVINMICICFCCSVAYIGYDYLFKLLSTGQLSPAMRIPIIWAYAAVPLGCFLMTLRYILLIIEQVTFLIKGMNPDEIPNLERREETVNG